MGEITELLNKAAKHLPANEYNILVKEVTESALAKLNDDDRKAINKKIKQLTKIKDVGKSGALEIILRSSEYGKYE
jgi:hypothetical protein